MKKILLMLLLLGTSLFAELKQVMATPEFLEKNPNVKIIDIRTSPEWRETGIVKGSYPIVSFTQRGFNPKFLEELDKVIKKDETFALICRTGSRTAEVSKWLADKGYNVIDLKGGLMHMIRMGYKPVRYMR